MQAGQAILLPDLTVVAKAYVPDSPQRNFLVPEEEEEEEEEMVAGILIMTLLTVSMMTTRLMYMLKNCLARCQL